MTIKFRRPNKFQFKWAKWPKTWISQSEYFKNRSQHCSLFYEFAYRQNLIVTNYAKFRFLHFTESNEHSTCIGLHNSMTLVGGTSANFPFWLLKKKFIDSCSGRQNENAIVIPCNVLQFFSELHMDKKTLGWAKKHRFQSKVQRHMCAPGTVWMLAIFHRYYLRGQANLTCNSYFIKNYKSAFFS